MTAAGKRVRGGKAKTVRARKKKPKISDQEKRRRRALKAVTASRDRRKKAHEIELARPPLPPPPATCSDEEKRFIVEYLKDLNGSAAMIRAGITDKDKVAKVYASRYLERPHVLMELAQRRADWIASTELSLERVLEELRRVGITNLSDVTTWNDDGVLILHPKAQLTQEQLSAIASIEEEPGILGSRLRVKMHPKVEALKELRKALSPSPAEVRFGASLGSTAGGTATIVIEGGPTGLEVTVKQGKEDERSDDSRVAREPRTGSATQTHPPARPPRPVRSRA